MTNRGRKKRIKPPNNHRPKCVGMSFLCTISRPYLFHSPYLDYVFHIHHISAIFWTLDLLRPRSASRAKTRLNLNGKIVGTHQLGRKIGKAVRNIMIMRMVTGEGGEKTMRMRKRTWTWIGRSWAQCIRLDFKIGKAVHTICAQAPLVTHMHMHRGTRIWANPSMSRRRCEFKDPLDPRYFILIFSH